MNTKTELKKIGGEKFLNEKDLKAFGKAEKKIYELMCDLKWHSATDIETKRESESRDFSYKMSVNL
jgi:hypothetical protein